jgi:hypothetical protein
MSEIETSLLPQTYSDIRDFTQGIEVKDYARRVFESNSPLLSSGRSDFSVEVMDLGHHTGPGGYQPFTEKRGTITAVQMLDAAGDVGIYGDDRGFINSTIEPLPVRLTATTQIIGVVPACGIKADCETLSLNSRPSAQIVNFYERESVSSTDNAFFDATDTAVGKPIPGFMGMFGSDRTPFNEGLIDPKGIVVGRFFRHGGSLGPTRRSAGTGFTYHNSDYGVDSVAFGGLKR